MTSRHTALAGAVFVPAFAAGMLLVNNPDGNASDARFAAFYGDSGHRGQLIVAGACLCVAALSWLVFTIGLRERLGEGTPERIAGGSATLAAALICVGGTLLAAIPAAVSLGNAPLPGADLERVLPIGGYLAICLFGMPATSLTLVAVGTGALREQALPRPLAWSALITSVLLLGSLEFFPIVALILWVAAAVIVLARRPLRIPLPATA